MKFAAEDCQCTVFRQTASAQAVTGYCHISRSYVWLPPAPPPRLSVDLDAKDNGLRCSSSKLQGRLQTPTEPVQLDSDSDDDPLNPQPVPNPLGTPALPTRRQLSGEPRTRTLEATARSILQQSQPPTKADVVRLFHMLPPHLVRNTTSGMHVVGGASPRHCMQCACSTKELPVFTQVVNSFLASQHSSHVYTTFVIRAGCQSAVHRDVRNGPTKALAQQLTPTEPGEGLWIQDVTGDVVKQFKGVAIRGTVVSLQDPFIFDSHRLLHAGHSSHAHARIIIVAFATIHASTLPWWIKEYLLDLGFRLPTPQQISEVTHGTLHCAPPRLKQLTLNEALQLPTRQLDQHEVVEVHD